MDTGKIADALINEAQQDCRVIDRMTRLAEISTRCPLCNDLKTVMDPRAATSLYGADQRQPVAMDYRTKSSLLATLDYLEQLRRERTQYSK